MSTDNSLLDLPSPGTYTSYPAEVYHRLRGASQSRLKELRRSPGHMLSRMENPGPPAPHLVIGSALHDAVLLPQLFEGSVFRGPEGEWTRKAQREVLDAEFKGCSRLSTSRYLRGSESPDRCVLHPDLYDNIIAARDAVWSHPTASRLLDVDQSDRELTLSWVDKGSGVGCKGRVDAVNEGAGALVDLKSTRDASESRFQRDIYNYGYYLQGAHYCNAAAALGIGEENLFAIVAVELERPWGVAVYNVKDAALAAGQQELEPLLELWAKCEAEGRWPLYPDEATDITLPPWAWQQIDERTGK